jgi:hypothetical protein
MAHLSFPGDIDDLLRSLARVVGVLDDLPDEATPAGKLTREFFFNNWLACRDGLLARTDRIRVQPQPTPAPRIFRFEIDCRYKSKPGSSAPVQLMSGPISGTIHYRPEVLLNRLMPPIAVEIDRSLAFFHPNYSRQHGFLCLGEFPPSPYPFPLDLLLENHLYPIVTYQNHRPAHPLDREAAHYFALDPQAMEGLEPVDPLY